MKKITAVGTINAKNGKITITKSIIPKLPKTGSTGNVITGSFYSQVEIDSLKNDLKNRDNNINDQKRAIHSLTDRLKNSENIAASRVGDAMRARRELANAKEFLRIGADELNIANFRKTMWMLIAMVEGILISIRIIHML